MKLKLLHLFLGILAIYLAFQFISNLLIPVQQVEYWRPVAAQSVVNNSPEIRGSDHDFGSSMEQWNGSLAATIAENGAGVLLMGRIQVVEMPPQDGRPHGDTEFNWIFKQTLYELNDPMHVIKKVRCKATGAETLRDDLNLTRGLDRAYILEEGSPPLMQTTRNGLIKNWALSIHNKSVTLQTHGLEVLVGLAKPRGPLAAKVHQIALAIFGDVTAFNALLHEHPWLAWIVVIFSLVTILLELYHLSRAVHRLVRKRFSRKK